MMRWSTHRSLRHAAGLHADCRRDEQLAARWGFRAVRPTLVIPGNGGVRRAAFFPGRATSDPDFGIDPRAPVVVQPRGLRAYVRSETFFRAIPLIRHAQPEAVFVCPAMEGVAEAEAWRAELGVGESLRLLPVLDAGLDGRPVPPGGGVGIAQHARWDAQHPARSDGLRLSADRRNLELIREWITDGENGL